MPTNDFLPFGSAVGANVSTQAEYAALAARSNGFSAGTAISKQLNKAWRQSSVMSSVLAQFIADQSGNDVLDDGNIAIVQTNLGLAIKAAIASGVPYATQAQVNDGVDNSTSVTPKTLASAVQGQPFTAFITTGSASAFAVAAVPAIAAYAVGQRFQLTFNAAGGTTPTINVSGKGAKNAKQYASDGSKIAAIIVAGQTSDVFYDGTDFVLLDQLPNATGTTRPQFDNSLNLATTAFVQGVGLQFSSVSTPTTNTTLTAASNAGSLVVANSASQILVTLPASTTMPSKTAITFWSYGSGGMLIAVTGSDSIYLPSTVTTFAVPTGSSVTLVSNGANGWYAVGAQGTTGITGAFKNLSGSSTGLNAVATYTADEIVVSGFNLYQTLRSVSIAPSLANPIGANGLDTGTVGGSASTWYSVWVIWNGSAVSGLFSLSATSPVMPVGYTHKARVGWVRTDASLFPLKFNQFGRTVRYEVGGNVASFPGVTSGTATTASTIALASVVPITAGKAMFVAGTNSGFVAFAPVGGFVSTPGSNYLSTAQTNGFPFAGGWNASGPVPTTSGEINLRTQSVMYASTASTAVLQCMGWDDNL